MPCFAPPLILCNIFFAETFFQTAALTIFTGAASSQYKIRLLSTQAPKKFNAQRLLTISESVSMHTNQLIKTENVYVRYNSNDPSNMVTISLTFNDKDITMNRDGSEHISHTMKRLGITITKMTSKNSKKAKRKQQGSINVAGDIPTLTDSAGSVINLSDLTNAEGWGTLCLSGDRGVRLNLPGDKPGVFRKVVYNLPMIREISCAVQGPPMCGHPLVAACVIEFSASIEYEWIRCSADVSIDNFFSDWSRGSELDPNFVTVGREQVYMPTSLDVGYKLFLLATPVSQNQYRGTTCIHELSHTVIDGQMPGLLEFRGGDMKSYALPLLRVTSWNVLADRYCNSDFSAAYLYPYCPFQFRETGYRSQVIVRELLGYNSDLVCLQECDKKVFNNVFKPVFEAFGYTCLFRNKCGAVAEGSASFIKSDKFDVVSSHDFDFKKKVSKLEVFSELWESIPHLHTILAEKLTTTAQITVLKVKGSEQHLILANTHLFFHPNAAHIRLIQLVTLMHEIQRLRLELVNDGYEVGVLVCGDLNSTPKTAIEFMEGKTIDYSHRSWKNANTFMWGERYFKSEAKKAQENLMISENIAEKTSESYSEMDDELLAHSENLLSASCEIQGESDVGLLMSCVPLLKLQLPMENVSGYPPFTNFTPAFSDTLDYIFADSDTFSVISRAPFPTREDMLLTTIGLPFKGYPSDHLAVVVDLSMKNNYNST